jgi:putative Mn2+ efflux pump MntP
MFELILFSLVLSTDSFSAALAMGTRPFTLKRASFFAFSSGLSEGLAAYIGYVLGLSFIGILSASVQWLAFVALWIVGLNMIYNGIKDLRSGSDRTTEIKVHGSLKILFISMITSFDALGVGVSLGAVGKPIFIYAPVIALFAMLATYLGLFLARNLKNRLQSKWSENVEIFGGVILLCLGVKFLLG